MRASAEAKSAALAAVVKWLSATHALPIEAFWAPLAARFGPETEATRAKLLPFLDASA